MTHSPEGRSQTIISGFNSSAEACILLSCMSFGNIDYYIRPMGLFFHDKNDKGLRNVHSKLFSSHLKWITTLNKTYMWPPNIFNASSENKNRYYKIYNSINHCFAETLQIIPFKNDQLVLHRRSSSKGTVISKSHTFYYNIQYSTETLSIYNFVYLKM